MYSAASSFLLVAHIYLVAEGVHIHNIRSIGDSPDNSIVLQDSELIKVNEKKEVRENEDKISIAIEKLAQDIPIDRFLEDPVLVQTVDRINSFTKYTIPTEDEDHPPEVLFERHESDNLKEVVVLRPDEDKLMAQDTKHKSVYVVLRRVPNPTNTKPVHYFLFYAYLRPARPEDFQILDVFDEKQTIEWDNWDDGEIQRDTELGWTNCASTVFFSCGSKEIDLGQMGLANISNAISKNPSSQIKVGNEGYDPNEYYGLFEEFDDFSPKQMQGRGVEGEAGPRSGRSSGGAVGNILCGAFSIFSKPKCKDKNQGDKVKSLADMANDLSVPLPPPLPVPPLLPPAGSPLAKLFPPSLMPTYGSFYPGRNNNPGIFIPANKGMPSIFVADVDDSVSPKLINGDLYAPQTPTGPMTFIPQDKYMLSGVYNYRGTFVPEGLTEKGYIGGIHGSLSERQNNGIFISDVTPRNYYLDPKLADPKLVFVNPKLMNGADEVQTTRKPTQQKTISGIIFEGIQGGLRIFVPDGDGLAGYFLPSDPDHPAFGNAPHGEIYPKKNGIAMFFPDVKGAVSKYRDVPGAFGPDDLDGGGFIFGKMIDNVNGAVFVPNTLGRPYVYVRGSPDNQGIWAPFDPKKEMTTTAPPIVKSKNPEHYGIYFQGLPPIFFPKGKPIKGVISDDRSGEITLHGTFYPGTPGSFSYFEPDPEDINVVQKYPHLKSKFLPDQLANTYKGRKGIGGTFIADMKNSRNITFFPEVPSVPWYYDPDHPDEGVWSPSFSLESVTSSSSVSALKISKSENLSKLKQNPPSMIKGIYFKGTSGSAGVFIPDEISVQGIIIPDSNVYPQLHGMFIPGSSGDKSEFTLDSPMSLAPGLSFAAKFFPDGIRHPSQGVKGILTMKPDSQVDFIFRPDTPSKSFLLNPNKTEDNTLMWSPRIPGVPDETTQGTTSKHDTASADKTSSSSSSSEGIFGVLYPPVGGSKGIFLPDEKEVFGTFLFDSASYTNMHGKLVAGKYGNPPVFYPDDPAEGATLFNVAGMFMPDWMPSTSMNQGIRGRITAGDGGDNCVLRTDTPGKAYWYISGRLETQKIWSPLQQHNNNTAVRAQNGPTEATASMNTFIEGVYFEGEKGSPAVFMPIEGTEGYLTTLTDRDKRNKMHGVLYPEEPPHFVPDDFIYLPNSTTVQFTADGKEDISEVESFYATFIQGSLTDPPVLIPKNEYVRGWSNIVMTNTSTTTMTHNFTFVNNKWTNTLVPKQDTTLKNGISVGGGYRGYETKGKGFDGVMDATSPIFREFLEKRTSLSNRETGRRDEVPQNVVLVNDEKGSAMDIKTAGATIVNRSEYRTWLIENYMIKRTRITTTTINEVVEIAVPKQSEKYIQVKPTPKPWKINLNINSDSSAGNSGASGEGSKGTASGGVTGSIGNCKSFSTSANAVATANNGGSSHAAAHALNGGNANSLSKSDNGGHANSNADVEKGGMANSMANALKGGNADSSANAYGGGKANSVANAKNGGNMNAAANATKSGNGPECGDGGLPDEIVVESSAVANAMTGEASASANTQVKIDMAGIVAKLQAMMNKRREEGDDGDDGQTLDININAYSNANARSTATGRAALAGKSFKNISAGIYRSGWKAEPINISPNSTLLHEDIVFFGLGNCPFTKRSLMDLKKTEKPEDLVDFYLTTLRTGCVVKEKIQTLLLIVDGFLEVDEKILKIPDNHSYMKEAKLTAQEMQRFSRAFELSMFTKTLFLYEENPSVLLNEAKSPDGRMISRSVKFLTEHILNCLTEINASHRKHFVRLTRNNILTLKSVMTKLKTDKLLLNNCKNCEIDHDINQNDQVQVASLLQFIFHGLPPFTLGGKDIRLAFRNFFMANANEISKIMNTYRKLQN